jgi:hypothetical protein
MKSLLSIVLILATEVACSQEIQWTDTTSYRIKATLIKAEKLSPDCGIIAWALAQRFKIIESDHPYLKPNYSAVLIQPCPELIGRNFFIAGSDYEITVSRNLAAPFGYSVINNFKRNLFTFWIKSINPVSNNSEK